MKTSSPSDLARYIRKGGFTLLELLTVIAIIGVLGALITVATRAALQKAREARSVANLRQLGVAALHYAGDNRGQMVPHAIFDTSINENREWCFGYVPGDPAAALKEGILGPYLSNAQEILRDPTFPVDEQPYNPFLPATRPAYVAYGYNGFFLSKKVTTYGHWVGHQLSSVEAPSRTVMFATSGELTGGKVSIYENIWPPTRTDKPVVRAVNGTHALVCWVSGHVSRVALDAGSTRTTTNPVLGHIVGPGGENIFARFPGDTGDKK